MSIKLLKNTFRKDSDSVLYEYGFPDLESFGHHDASIFISYNSTTQIMQEYFRFGTERELIFIGASLVEATDLAPLIERVLDIDFKSLLPCINLS